MNGTGVEPVERQPDLLVLAGDVEMVVEPAEHLGRLVDQVDVGLGIEVAEDVVGVLEHVEVLDLGGQAPDLQRLLDRVGRPKVPRPGAGGQDQYTSQHLEPPAVRYFAPAVFRGDSMNLLQQSAPIFRPPRKLRSLRRLEL